MDATTLLALERVTKQAAKAAKAREEVAAGDYKFDTVLTFNLKGELRVAEDFEWTPTVSIPIKETLALFMRYCGATREAAMAGLMRAMKEAHELEEKGETCIAELADLKEMEKQVVESLGQLPKELKKGAVTGKLTLTEIVSTPPMETEVKKAA